MRTKLDKIIQRSVVTKKFDTIAEEMGYVLEKSSRSPIFAEACDFACGICNWEGELVSQLNGIPILAAAGSFSVKAVLKKYEGNISDGDIFIVNDPYNGGNHLPDIGIIVPVFSQNQLVFFCVCRAHHGDIGGSAAGSYNSKATEIFQEGLRIPPTKIGINNTINTDILDLITLNTRAPQMLQSDLRAQIGACQIGKQRLATLLEKYSLAEVREIVNESLAAAEKLTKEFILNLPDGNYIGQEWVDDDGFQSKPILLQANVIIKGDRMTVDFSGTDPQVKGFVNSALVTTASACYIACLWVLGPKIPRNGGAFRAIEVKAPLGSLVNPLEPAPVTLSTLTPAGEIINAIFKALSDITLEGVPAGYGRYCGPSFYGIDPRNNKFYVGFAFCCLGSGGAIANRDGLPYMSPVSNFGGVRTPNIETNEVQYPHLTLRHEMECDTAGSGKYRGGPGICYKLQFYSSLPYINMFGDGMQIPPYGLRMGSPGSVNKAIIDHSNGLTTYLGSKEEPRLLAKGDQLILISSGGGGWGDPLERTPETVWEDFNNGLISKDKAEKDYGVVLIDSRLDMKQTLSLRKRLKNARPSSENTFR